MHVLNLHDFIILFMVLGRDVLVGSGNRGTVCHALSCVLGGVRDGSVWGECFGMMGGST